MKKFIAGFLVGGLLFGTVTAFAQDLKNVLFNINSMQVDGEEVALKSASKPFTFNNQAYFPSYLLPELGYVAERTKDKNGITLRSIGKTFYPVKEDWKTKNSNVLRVKGESTSNAKLNIFFKTSNHMLTDVEGKVHDHYIHIDLDTSNDAASFAAFLVPLDEKFRRFSARFQLVTQNTDAPLNGAVTLSAYVTDDSDQETLVKSWSLDASKKVEDISLPLRYAKGVRYKLTSTHKGKVKVALLSAKYVK